MTPIDTVPGLLVTGICILRTNARRIRTSFYRCVYLYYHAAVTRVWKYSTLTCNLYHRRAVPSPGHFFSMPRTQSL